MPEQPPTLPESIRVGHELSGVHTRGVFWFIAWFLAVGALLHVLLWITLGLLHKRTIKEEPPPSPIGSVRPLNLDQPLQPSPATPPIPQPTSPP